MSIQLDLEKCKSCGLCLDVCPNDLIKYSDKYNSKQYRLIQIKNKDFCFHPKCNKCVNICPDNVFKEDNNENYISAFFYWIGRKYYKSIKKIKRKDV
ncbi:MAG: hypothetical protein KatS3mg068_0381 [Candidatus Sericytochromatia bacterium]|nr:MAG: hypothetical protein KatS3mg068_0381 [Candidatus Sericytochromatia bacterium]